MKLYRYIILFFITLICAVYAFDWPLKKKILLSTFCQNNGEGFSTGIHLSGLDEPVFPVAPGEMIFSYQEGKNHFAVPYGLGSFTVLWHEGGIQSTYCQLKTDSLHENKIKFQKDESLGLVGNTGATIGGNLRLIIFNIEEKEILNPIKNLIPYFEDSKKPVIPGIFIKRNDEIIQLKNDLVIHQGNAEILVKSFDLREDKQRIWEIAPYKIVLFHNGQRINQISFDSLREKENKQVLSGLELTYSDIYEETWLFKLGNLDFLEGISHIQVKVSDFAGNTVSEEFFINVAKL
ncbi:MAG: hypothetical protein JXB88_06700 [Spirochaetales bacterium]|nr:hypothetical protein [Spirochaetales bacterium]